MHLAIPTVRPGRIAGALAGVALAAALAVVTSPADIVREAAGVGDTPTDLNRFVAAANALVTPGIVVVAAICPIACLVGLGMTMFGNRKGMVVIGAALGSPAFTAALKGVVA
jgi:hypothetical protein